VVEIRLIPACSVIGVCDATSAGSKSRYAAGKPVQTGYDWTVRRDGGKYYVEIKEAINQISLIEGWIDAPEWRSRLLRNWY
jgi:hypothetical protein